MASILAITWAWWPTWSRCRVRSPTYVFTGSLTLADHKRYIPLPFHVPAGTTRIHVDFHFDPWKVDGIKNTISLSLYEPDGTFRGFRHVGRSSTKAIDVGAGGAEAGFFPGALPPGDWTVELDLFMILPGAPVHYELRIWLSDEAESEAREGPCFPRPVVCQKVAWYRGDLHVHTCHSDGRLSVAEMVDVAREFGLDFIALTDHNNVTQLYHPDLDGVDDLAIIPGMEFTTYYGHALSLGTTDWFDWRVGHGGRRMEDAVAEVHQQGGTFIAAHIATTGDPICTGCKWLFGQLMPGALDALEIWNGCWDRPRCSNEVNLQIWYHWLNAGHRLPATAGSDAHGGYSYAASGGIARYGFNLIWADELSAKGLLDGLHQGHVMLSSGPRLWIEAPLPDGGTAMMGDTVPATDWMVPITVRWADTPADAVIRLVVDGDVHADWRTGLQGEQTVDVVGVRWVVAEMRDAQGCMLALTNPIYLDRELNL